MLIFSQQEDLLHKVIVPVLIKLSLLLREQTEISLFNLCDRHCQNDIYLLNPNDKNTRAMREICSELTMKISK